MGGQRPDELPQATSSPTVGVSFMTLDSRRHLPRSLPPLLASPLSPRVLVVDTSSRDGTAEAARELGLETLVVSQAEFNHGLTRERARQELGTDIVVMITGDAYAADEHTLGRLVAPLVAGTASLAYGRQVPHPGANLFEAFSRSFNYPAASHVRGIEDRERYGVYLFFSSNAFAAYRNSALDEIGGFPATLSHEDAIVAALLLRRGHKIAYVADAIVEHSHRYGLRQEFRRHFDAGYAREEYREELALGGTHGDLGRRYAKELLALALRSRPLLLPYALTLLAAKWLGFALGRKSLDAPAWLNRRASTQTSYWSAPSVRAARARRARG